MVGYLAAAGLLDRTTLRATWLAFRGDLEAFQPPDEPDPELVAHVATPFESVVDVIDRLSRLETYLRARGDRRAVFLTIYVRMTRAVREGIERGRFAKPGWMRRYLVRFADHYRRALVAFERGALGAVPDPWRVAFGAAIREETLVVQDAFLGVNAHINYDLAPAIVDVGIDPDRARKYADHRAIDDILTTLVDIQQAVLADVYAAGVDDVDAALGRVDESLTLFSMTTGRERAWRTAVVITDADRAPVPAVARWVSRTTATGAAFAILSPALDPVLADRLRKLESDGLDLDTVMDRVHDRFDDLDG